MPMGVYTHLPLTPEKREARFWSQVDPCRTDGCALFMGSLRKDGYGRFAYPDGKTGLAHHYLVGKPPKPMEWDHLCRIHNCVWPEHLELVTHKENCQRGLRGSLYVYRPPVNHTGTSSHAM